MEAERPTYGTTSVPIPIDSMMWGFPHQPNPTLGSFANKLMEGNHEQRNPNIISRGQYCGSFVIKHPVAYISVIQTPPTHSARPENGDPKRQDHPLTDRLKMGPQTSAAVD